MKKIILILLLAFSPALFINSVYAQKPGVVTSDKAGWHKIGEVTADFKTDRDEIMVMGADKYKAIKLKATDAPIHITDMKVMYEGAGGTEDISVKNEFKAGGESRVINLKHSDVSIKNVSFMYHTVPNAKNEKAHVELWGLK